MPPPTAASKAISSPASDAAPKISLAVERQQRLVRRHDVLARREGFENEFARHVVAADQLDHDLDVADRRSVPTRRQSNSMPDEVDAPVGLEIEVRNANQCRSGKAEPLRNHGMHCPAVPSRPRSRWSRSRSTRRPTNSFGPLPRSSLLVSSLVPLDAMLSDVRTSPGCTCVPDRSKRPRRLSGVPLGDQGLRLDASPREGIAECPRTACRIRCLFSTRAKRTNPSP